MDIKTVNEIKKAFNSWMELNEDASKLEIYVAGYNLYEQLKNKEKIIKEKRKNRVFIPEDFINKAERMDTRYFLKSLHYENNKVITTDARYLLVCNYDYEKDREGKTFDSEGTEINCQYPKWEKVIPSSEDCILADDFTLEDLKIVSSNIKTKSHSKLEDTYVTLKGNICFNSLIIKLACIFWEDFPEAKLYKNKEDLSKAWYLEDRKGNKFVFMPCSAETSLYAHYRLNEDKVLIKRSE